MWAPLRSEGRTSCFFEQVSGTDESRRDEMFIDPVCLRLQLRRSAMYRAFGFAPSELGLVLCCSYKHYAPTELTRSVAARPTSAFQNSFE